ncbi:MAG: hypothetical protein HFF52_09165 [Lawsonibacter sp.]|nr:hypothetical protein [Lawsonibacter sp.]
MGKIVRRLLSSALAAALVAGMCLTASAYGDFKYPNAYWKLHSAWDEAVSAQNLDQIISVAQQTYDLLTGLGMGQDVCENLEPKAKRAAWACEMKGDIDGAITWMQRQHDIAKWLTDSGLSNTYGNKYDYTLVLQSIESRMNYLNAAKNVTIYAQSKTSASPYSVGPRTGTWYGSPVDGSRTDGSAALMYVTFGDSYSMDYWINYYRDTSPMFRKAADGGVIELAWNFSPESTAGAQAVLSADSYIADSLRALGGLNATILLRVGAEMNCWADSDPAVYKQAFQKVASAARAYPNIQMVYSPNDLGSRVLSIHDYYPGDEYVDWIGMSTYHTTNYKAYRGGESSYTLDYDSYYDDAYYGVGVYDHDPLVTIKPIVDLADAHGKPVMISECGFAYRNGAGEDLSAFAADQMNWFYSYLNMVYPQVKAVFYFDASVSTTEFSYSLAGSGTMDSAYTNVLRSNGAYLSETNGTVTGWETLDKTVLTDSTGVLRLAAYASFPGRHTTTVNYYVDNNLVHTSTQAPHYYDLSIAGLVPGAHSVRVEASGGQFSGVSQTYTLTVPGSVTPDPTPEDVAYAVDQSIEIDGEPVAFQTYALVDENGNGTNYVKLRDIAFVLKGTGAQFDVTGFDSATGSISLATGQAYTVAGGEMSTPFAGENRPYQAGKLPLNIDGTVKELEAIALADDAGNGYNYFKLRDLGAALGFNVGWSTERSTIFIETDKPYTGN